MRLCCAVVDVAKNKYSYTVNTANNVKKKSYSVCGAPVGKTSHSRSLCPLTSKELTEIYSSIQNKINGKLSKIINPTKSKLHKGSPASISSTKSSTPAQSKARKVSGTGILPIKTRKPAQSTPQGGSQVSILSIRTRKTTRRGTYGSSRSGVSSVTKARKFGRHWRPSSHSTLRVARRIRSNALLSSFTP